ncbi:site-specific DNA-methyltransferase [Helicobacter marmotae]|uniref:Methyltransferase n=1 Tax=Helicobacter marmotae TaxID=152490 RepID=A0A3D8I4I5_9HELI|nr:site-specific DNA-methyltransferase [Helicobacter marmotae]RDU60058.1 site-specific DNA-methyltransferase [Helicobacter marmotae]
MKSLNKNFSPIFTSEDSLFRLYQGDCNQILPDFRGAFDLIFADPPYFLSNDGLSIQSGKIVSVNKGTWDREDNINDIDEFNQKWIANAKIALKDTGSILVSGTYHNIFSLGRVLQKLDFKILNLITWQKTNPPPNFSCRYLTHSTEQIIWARKSPKHKHIFNYEILKKLNGDKQMRDVWSFPAIAPWEKTNGKHPTQKPLNLLARLLLMASNEDSVICDPFSGSSTTGIAANLLNRSFVGIEKESEFIKISMDRKVELDKNRKEIKSKIKDLQTLGFNSSASNRIINEVNGINPMVYDITSKHGQH